MKELNNLKQFFEKIKTIGLLERIFSWRKIKNLSYDAYEEYKSIDQNVEELNEKIIEKKHRITELNKDLEHSQKDEQKNENELTITKKDLMRLQEEKLEKEKKIKEYETIEKKKAEEYEEKINSLKEMRGQMDQDRIRIQEEREKEIEQRHEEMKKTWKEHENKVESTIREICRKYTIEYLDKEKLPFKGKPDNTIQIAGEYILFDAKSPYNNNLDNFPTYIKTQTESLKKYVKEKEVKREIYLIVPTNTIEQLKQTYYNLSEYNVYIITIDSIEPIILSLKKVEEYEFIEEMTPEDRENIARILGRFAHATKRRIQIDQYFTDEFIDILTKTQNLPKEIIDKSVEHEKSGKLNPPQEKRVRNIELKELKEKKEKIKRRAEGENISLSEDLSSIEKVPLEKKDKKE